MPKMNPEEQTNVLPAIHEYFTTLKRISGKGYVPLWKLAAELNFRQVALYNFVRDNPDNFIAHETFETKIKRTRNDSLKENLSGEKYTEHEERHAKGFCIHEVYLRAHDNPNSAAWLGNKQTVEARVIVLRANGDGYILKADKEDLPNREHLWRNTPIKIATLANKYNLYEIEDNTYGVGKDTAKRLTDDGWDVEIKR